MRDSCEGRGKLAVKLRVNFGDPFINKRRWAKGLSPFLSLPLSAVFFLELFSALSVTWSSHNRPTRQDIPGFWINVQGPVRGGSRKRCVRAPPRALNCFL